MAKLRLVAPVLITNFENNMASEGRLTNKINTADVRNQMNSMLAEWLEQW